MKNNGIKSWPAEDRPREKLLQQGVESLSTTELLAILFQSGTRHQSVQDLSQELLAACNNNLLQLAGLSVREILQLKVKGMGPGKAIALVAALELGQRRLALRQNREKIQSSKDVAGFLQARFQFLAHEVFAVVFLNRANRVLHHEVVSEGGITGTVADPRIILKKALEHRATGLILCHNHPSGNLRPSLADEQLTQKIKQAAGYLDIQVMDHLIVSQEGYFSFADEGML
ncbi:MAG: JAB domain-containing protein [Sphingobacteriia bacterium]|nr:MAG: JAB domain-containing protein [Sphingobacteriia bacterium]